MEAKETFKYFAFISYSSADTSWGRRLQRRLEQFRLPSTICNIHGFKRKPFNPVFFAPSDIQPGPLGAELEGRLRDSRNLIVVCSPASARSKWVGREIEYFNSLGRSANIHLFIVGGEPNSGNPETECFNPALKEIGLPELLGVNVHEKVFRSSRLNRERAYIQLATKLLGIDFDTLWQRHRRLMWRKRLAWTGGIIGVAVAIVSAVVLSLPADVEIGVRDASVANPNLPPLDKAVITLSLDNEEKTDTVYGPAMKATFSNIPKRFMGSPVRIAVSSPGWQRLDTTVVLKSDMDLPLTRDYSIYGDVHFKLWDPSNDNPAGGVEIAIGGYTSTSSPDGTVSIRIAPEDQRTAYRVEASRNLYNDSIVMPCGDSDVLLVR